MNFKKWLETEIKLFSSIDLTEDGIEYYNILRKISELINDDNIEIFIRKNIKNNKDKKHFQYIYRQFLINEDYIEDDKIS